MNNTNTTIIINTEKLEGENPSIEFLPPPPVEAPYDWFGLACSLASSSDDEEREALNTFAAEPAVEQEPESL